MDQGTPTQHAQPEFKLHDIFGKIIPRKYSFSLISFFTIIFDLWVVHKLNFPEKVSIVAIIASEVPILVIAVSFLTGQATVELSALYGHSQMPGMVNPMFSTAATLMGAASTLMRPTAPPPPPPPGGQVK